MTGANELVFSLTLFFWQALGKAMGWGHYFSVNFSGKNMWQFYWHRLINTLAEGKSAEDFFAQFQ